MSTTERLDSDTEVVGSSRRRIPWKNKRDHTRQNRAIMKSQAHFIGESRNAKNNMQKKDCKSFAAEYILRDTKSARIHVAESLLSSSGKMRSTSVHILVKTPFTDHNQRET